MASSWLTIPNVISLARLALVPVFLWLRVTGEGELALMVFVVASVSDIVDGLLARLLNQRSKLGGIIDPVADKLLVFTALTTLTVERVLPWWLLALILARDVPMGIGLVVVRRKHLEVPASPSRVGKYATFTLVLTIVLALGLASPRAPQALEGYTVAIAFVAGLCVLVSTLQYWARFGYLFFAPERPERKTPSADEGKRTPA